MSDKAHAILSPSKTERWWNCPGSIALCKDIPETTSEYAKEGTVAHEVLSRCIKDGKLTPFDMIGIEIDGIEVTEEMAEAVAVAVDYVRNEAFKGGQVLSEEQVVVVKDKIFGTLDIAIIRPFNEIIVIDYKHGQGVQVLPDDNPQLLCYTAGLADQYEVEKYKLVIIQPRCMQDGAPINEWVCDNEYLTTWKSELLRHIALTEEKDALICSGIWCKFCPAKAQCPVLRGELVQGLPKVKNRELIFPEAASLTVDAIVKVLDYRARIEEWFDAVQAYALTVLESGGAIPGYMLGKKRSNRRWIDESKVVAKYRAELGDKMFSVKPLFPAQLEKLIGKERKDELSELTEQPDNGNTIKKAGKK